MKPKLSPLRHSETAFETVIEDHLLENGYVHVMPTFDVERAIFPNEALHFIQTTQPKEWARLEALHGDRTGDQLTIRAN
jgi:type I restriction enzyme R subunit